MEPVIGPLSNAHGYSAVLWCSTYMGGWPMGWTNGDWYSQLGQASLFGRARARLLHPVSSGLDTHDSSR